MNRTEIKRHLLSLYAQKELIVFLENEDFFNKKVETFLSDHVYPQAESKDEATDKWLNSLEFHRVCWEIELGV